MTSMTLYSDKQSLLDLTYSKELQVLYSVLFPSGSEG